jgi:hypothetical protein
MRFRTIYTHSEHESFEVPQQGMCRKGKTVDVTWDLYPVVRNVRFFAARFGKLVSASSGDPETLRPDIHSSTHNDCYYE